MVLYIFDYINKCWLIIYFIISTYELFALIQLLQRDFKYHYYKFSLIPFNIMLPYIPQQSRMCLCFPTSELHQYIQPDCSYTLQFIQMYTFPVFVTHTWAKWSEAWVLKKREKQLLEAAQMKFLRHLLGITKLDKEKNHCIREKTGAENIVK